MIEWIPQLVLMWEPSVLVIQSEEYLLEHVEISSMIKDLKGTREQRIKAIEGSKQTFSALIKKIILDPDFRHVTGIEMEKMRLAMDKERERLSEAHTYEDSITDQPFLTPETVEG